MSAARTYLVWTALSALLYFPFVAYMPVETFLSALLYAGSALALSGAAVLWVRMMERRPPEEVTATDD